MRIELCKDKIDSSPLQNEIANQHVIRDFCGNTGHIVVLYVDFEKLWRTENLFQIKILKQQVDCVKNLNRFTDIRLKRDSKMHFEDHNATFCIENLKIYENFMSDGKFPMYFFNKI